MNFPKIGFRSFGVTLVLVLAAAVVPSSNPAVAASGRHSVSITGFANGSSALSKTMKTKALSFVKKNRGYKTATCIDYADKSGSAAVNQRLAVARANTICSLINGTAGISKVKAVGRWNSKETGGNIRRVEINLSDPRGGGGGGGGGTPACEDIDPWPNFEGDHWVVYPDPTLQAYEIGGGDWEYEPGNTRWVYDAYYPGNWGIVVRKRDEPHVNNWPAELYYECVVNSDVVLEYTSDEGATWVSFDNELLQTLKPGGSTETLAYNAFDLDPARFPTSYFTNSRFHWTVTTEFQTWDYYSYLTDRVPVWIDVDYDAFTPAGATNVIVQYDVPGGGQTTAYVTPGTPLSVTVARGGALHIVAPALHIVAPDADVSYDMVETEGATVTTDAGNTFVAPGFTGWTTTGGTIWSYTVGAESAYNLTSISN